MCTSFLNVLQLIILYNYNATIITHYMQHNIISPFFIPLKILKNPQNLSLYLYKVYRVSILLLYDRY